MDEKDLKIIREIRKITRKNPETENYFIFRKYFFIAIGIVLFIVVFLMLSFIKNPTTLVDSLFSFLFFLCCLFPLFIRKEKELRINAYVNFYLEELEKRNIEITEMFYVRTYLERYILYKIYRESENLTEECRNYFKKRTPTELTEEQLYLSAELFPSKYSFIVKVVSEYNG